MVIGRSSLNSIKIKTDSKGIQALECACCVKAPCGCAIVPAPLKAIIKSATEITVNGMTKAWVDGGASHIVVPDFTQPNQELSWMVSYEDGVVCVLGDNGNQTVSLSPSADKCLIAAGGAFDKFIAINNYEFTANQAFPFDPISLSITFS